MKRPEGFDQPARRPSSPPSTTQGASPAAAQSRTTPPRATPPRATPPRSTPTHPDTELGDSANTPPKKQKASTAPRPRATAAGPRPDVAAKRELRRAAQERRRVERAEVRRFTRRSRQRRIAVGVVLGTIAALIALVFVAVFSPILALREVKVDGTSRIDGAEVQAAVEEQLGTPLALIDEARITEQLSVFPLIRSYSIEMVPPGTLLVHIVERAPIATVKVGDTYRLVDAAGIVVQETTDRVPGVPLFDLGGADVPGPGFDASVAVLLSLPTDLAARVDVVTARTEDDVTLTLAGVGQSVVWGSAEQSARKANLLTGLLAQIDPNTPGQFDVSAPNNGIFRPL